MKKIALSIVLASTLLLATDNTKQDCIENFQNELFSILNEDKPKSEKEKAIEKLNKSVLEACDDLPEKKPTPRTVESEDCIEEFESDVIKALLATPEDKKKDVVKGVYKEYKEKCDGKF